MDRTVVRLILRMYCRILRGRFILGVDDPELCQESNDNYPASRSHVDLCQLSMVSPSSAMGYGSLHECGDQHLVLNSQTRVQQARFLTLDHRFELCFHQSQAYLNLLLFDLDIYPMHIVPSPHDFYHRHVVDTLH